MIPVFIFLTLFSLPVLAQEKTSGHDICKLVQKSVSVPAADYMPGVDVHGKPVVPADLNGGGAIKALPDVIKIPLTVDLAKSLNVPLPANSEMQAGVTMIEVHSDGHVVYNGLELTQNVSTICGEKDEKRPEKRPKKAKKQQKIPVTTKDKSEKGDIIWGEGH